MVSLIHHNVTVRPSKSSEMNPSTNLTSFDATKPNASENTFLRSVFMLLTYIMSLCTGLCIRYVPKIFGKTNISYQGVKNISFLENFCK